MSEQNTNEIDRTELARKAINHVLQQIKKNPDVRYHMGAFTESFELLKQAHSAFNGISEAAIEQDVFALLLNRPPAAKKIDQIKALIDDWDGHSTDASTTLSRIKTVCYQ